MVESIPRADVHYDGHFVYAVQSTGIYCRPTCPSRRPRLEQVRFFSSPGEAEQASYRPCRRCLPDQPSRENRQADLVRRVCDYVNEYLRNEPEGLPSLAQISQAAGVSPSHLQRVFKTETGLTPRQYAHAGRLERFKSLVREGHPVSEAMFDAGFGSSSRLYENANGQMGMTPGKYKRGEQDCHQLPGC